MAYFANSTEGDTLEIQCEDCLLVCPVYSAQSLFNYDQHGDGQEKLKQCLEILIDKDGVCQMKKAMENPK